MLSRNPPAPKAPGKTTPKGTATSVCSAMLVAESSGIIYTNEAAVKAEKAAPPNKAIGGSLIATPATGSSAGDSSMAVPIRGRSLSLEASNTPSRSFSSANFRRGAADFRVNPALSSLVNSPSSEV